MTKVVLVQLAIQVPSHVGPVEAMTLACERVQWPPKHLAATTILMTEASHVTEFEGANWTDHEKGHEAMHALVHTEHPH